MNKTLVLLILGITVTGGFFAVGAASASPLSQGGQAATGNITAPVNVTNQTPDLQNINAQVYGNQTATDGFPAYLNYYETKAVMPQSMWIVARAPSTPQENSTLTVSVNGTYVVTNLQFRNVVNYSFTTRATGNVPIVVTLHSSGMNRTKAIRYTAQVETVQKFVNYYQNKIKPPSAGRPSLDEAFVVFAPAAGAGVFLGVLFAIYIRWQKNTNIDLSDTKVGGVGGWFS